MVDFVGLQFVLFDIVIEHSDTIFDLLDGEMVEGLGNGLQILGLGH